MPCQGLQLHTAGTLRVRICACAMRPRRSRRAARRRIWRCARRRCHSRRLRAAIPPGLLAGALKLGPATHSRGRWLLAALQPRVEPRHSTRCRLPAALGLRPFHCSPQPARRPRALCVCTTRRRTASSSMRCSPGALCSHARPVRRAASLLGRQRSPICEDRMRGTAGRRRVLAVAARARPRRVCQPRRGSGGGAAHYAACVCRSAVLAHVRMRRGRQENLLQGRAGHGQVADAQAGARGLQGVQQIGDGAAAAAAAAGGQLVHLRRSAAVSAACRRSRAERDPCVARRVRLGLRMRLHIGPTTARAGCATHHGAARAGLGRTPAWSGDMHTPP